MPMLTKMAVSLVMAQTAPQHRRIDARQIGRANISLQLAA